MRFKGTLVLLILGLALGAWVYFYEIKGGEKREKAGQEEKQIWKVESGSIQEIHLEFEKQQVACVRTGEKEWRITVPRPLEADSQEVDRLASSAADLSRESVVVSDASDLAKFGLSPAEVTLGIKTKDGKDHKILFGAKNPTGNSTYASLQGGREVFLVADYVVSSFRKKLDDLRNRSILKFDQFEAQSMDLRSEKGTMQLVKEGDRWWITGKERLPADSSSVSGMLGSLSNTKLQEFLEGDPAEYANLGFDKPLLDVKLTVGKDKGIKHLLIGSRKSALRRKGGEKPGMAGPLKDAGSSGSELYIARDESRAELFFVEKDVVEKLLKSPSDLRDKALASFQRWDIDVIVLKNAQGSLTFVKSGGDWLLGDSKKKTKWEAVNGILDALEKPVKGFVDSPASAASYGLDPPLARAVLKQGASLKVDCLFGKPAKDGVFSMVKGESTVKISEKESFDAVNRGEEYFVEPPADSSKDGAPANPQK